MIVETMSVWELVTLKPKVSLGILGVAVGFLMLSSFLGKMRRSR